MPVYQRYCACGWETDFAFEPVADPQPQCPSCGHFETKRFLGNKAAFVIPDTFSTPIVDSVMTAKKQIHESRSARKRAMKKNRLQEFIRWTPGNESDKSAIHGSRWDAPPPGFLTRWETYWRERYPLTEDEKSRLVVTDDV